jgi:hypothetical protein
MVGPHGCRVASQQCGPVQLSRHVLATDAVRSRLTCPLPAVPT